MVWMLMMACQEKQVEDSAVPVVESVNDSSEVEDTEQAPIEEIILEEGAWAYSSITITTEDCGFPPEVILYLQQSIMGVKYNLNYVADNNYILSLDLGADSQASTSCRNTQNTFVCDDLVFPIPTYESTVTEIYSSTGAVSSSTRISGTMIKSHSCSGPDCEEIAEANSMSFPCSIEMDYTFNFFD